MFSQTLQATNLEWLKNRDLHVLHDIMIIGIGMI